MSYTILLIAVVSLYIIAGGYWLYALVAGAPFYPSNKKAINTITKFIQEELKISNVLELGSGDGRLANAIAISNTDASITAIEINPSLTILHRTKNLLKHIKNVDVKNGNFLKHNFAKYDLVITYLFPDIMGRLEDKMFDELKPGSFIISNIFKLKKHKPYKLLDNKIVVYKV